MKKQFRKIILSAIALISVASAQVFGMYGANSDWIDFLTDDNQFRARLDQLGFTLGNDTIKGSFGFRNELGLYGSLLSTHTMKQLLKALRLEFKLETVSFMISTLRFQWE